MAVKDIISQFEGSEVKKATNKMSDSYSCNRKFATLDAKSPLPDKARIEKNAGIKGKPSSKLATSTFILLPAPDLKSHIVKTDHAKYDVEAQQLSEKLSPDHKQIFQQIEDLLADMKKGLKKRHGDNKDWVNVETKTEAKKPYASPSLVPLPPVKNYSSSNRKEAKASPSTNHSVSSTGSFKASNKADDEVSTTQSYSTAFCPAIASVSNNKAVYPEKNYHFLLDDGTPKSPLVEEVIGNDRTTGESLERLKPADAIIGQYAAKESSSDSSGESRELNKTSGPVTPQLNQYAPSSTASKRKDNDLFEYNSYKKLLETPDTNYQTEAETSDFKRIADPQPQSSNAYLDSPVKFTIEMPVSASNPSSSSYSSLGSYTFPRKETTETNRIKHLEQTLERDENEERKKRWYHKFNFTARKLSMRAITQSDLSFRRGSSLKSKLTRFDTEMVGYPQLQVDRIDLDQLAEAKAKSPMTPMAQHHYRQLADPTSSPLPEKRMSLKVNTGTQTEETTLIRNFRELQTSIRRRFSQNNDTGTYEVYEEEDPVAEFTALVQEVFSK